MASADDFLDGTAPAAPRPRLRYDAPENVNALKSAANELGIDPVDLATVISYETGGTFDPDQAGPTTKWGQHRGLIQFGAPQRQKYGVRPGQSVAEQMPSVVTYLRDAGVKPGMGMMDVYSAINAGAPGRYNASDAAAGGAPGTVADKVNNQMHGHRKKAQAMLLGALGIGPANASEGAPTRSADDFLGGEFDNVQAGSSTVEQQGGVRYSADGVPDYSAVLNEPTTRTTSNPLLGLVDRANKLLGSGIRGVANVAEPIGDWLESKIPLSGLAPEQIQNERQLQTLHDVADWFGDTGIDYQPGTTFQDVKEDPLSMKTPKFIGETLVTSLPDMGAAVAALPAYVMGRTEEIAERRVANDGMPAGTQPGLGDMAAAAPAAVGEALLERFATSRIPGVGATGGNAAVRVAKEAGVQAGTEGLEEGIANLGESLGTERGVKADEFLDAVGAGALVGGGLGTAVQGTKEVATVARDAMAPVQPAQSADEFLGAPQQATAQPAPPQAFTPEAVQSIPPQPVALPPDAQAPDAPATATETATPGAAVPTVDRPPAAVPAQTAEPPVATASQAESVAVDNAVASAALPDMIADASGTVPSPKRQSFHSPSDLARNEFVQRAVEHGVPEATAIALAPKAAVDDVTGYFDGRMQGVKANTVERAQEHVLSTSESAFYVDGDIVNLGGLNKHAKDDMTVANGHFRAMSDILRGELEGIGADVVPLRTGGDELGAVVINAGEVEVRSALQAADAKIRVYAQQQGLDTIPHTKQGRTDVGVGLHLGLAPIVPGISPSEIFSRASAEVNQSKESADVSRSPTARTGAVAPDRPAAGIERGAGEGEAGLRPEGRVAEGAQGTPVESSAAAEPRSTQRVTADAAPMLESIDDRPAVPTEQEDVPDDGSDPAQREAAELESGSEGAGAPVENTRRKGASSEFVRASFTNRRSWAQAAFRDAGLDPDAAELLPIEKQFDAVAKAIADKFGLKIEKTPSVPARMAVDSALDLYRNAETMAHVLGLPAKAIGLGDTLTLLFRDQMPYLGAMYPGGATVEGVKIPAGSIALPRRSNSFAHEWGHALDLFLTGKYGMEVGKLVTRQIRSDGIDAQPDTSKAAFAGLMNAMFFEEADLAARVATLQQAAANGTDKQKAAATDALKKLANGNSKLKIDGTKYLINSRAFGNVTGGKAGAQYFGDPAELLARAFEAYIGYRVESAGGSTEVLAKGDAAYLSMGDERFALSFPKTADRVRIFAAFDDLFGQLAKEQLVAQGVAASNPGNLDTFDPRIWLGSVAKPAEYRGIKGAFREQADEWNATRDQQRRAKERPADPMSRKARVQNALMSWTTPIQGVFRTMERRYPKSAAMRELANKLTTAPGIDRVVGRVYEQAVRITAGRSYNQFGNIVSRYDLNKLDDAGRKTLRHLLVGATSPDKAPAELVKAAAELRRFMDSLWYDNQEAGINIGYTKNGYLPRVLDLALVQADPAAFIEAATKAYLAKPPAEGADPAKADQEAEAQARAWLFNLTNAPAMNFASKAPAENYSKHRSLPAEADVLLEKFYVSDPMEVIHRYIGMSARNIEFATAFGPKGEQLNALFEQMGSEGVALEDQKYLQGTVASLLGRQSGGPLDGKPRAQALMNQVNAYGVMAMLGRVLISSIAEPGMAGIRTGSAAAVYKPYFNLIKQAIGTADMKQWAEITRAIGLVGDAQADMVVQARLGGTYESTPKTDARLARYFSITGLHALTNAQRVSLMPITHRYLAQLVEQVKSGSASEMKEGAALLAELGIPVDGSFDLDAKTPTMTDLFDSSGRETEFGALYMTAMSRINEQIVQAPNRYDRPEMANSPSGRFLYGIMSFNMAFWNNVYKREAAVIARHATGKGAVGGTLSVAGYVGGHMAPPFMAYFFTQLLVTTAREALLNPQRWEEWDRDETLVENLMMLTLSRAFPMGLFDIPIQAYQGLKYQRDITSIAVGAVPSYFLMSLQKITAAFRSENSDKTNNAEFGAMQGAYQLVANPLIAHILTSLPGGRILDPIYGVSLAVGTAAAARDTVTTAVVGERDSLVAKRKRDEKKAAEGVESAGAERSARDTVRNNDRRESSR